MFTETISIETSSSFSCHSITNQIESIIECGTQLEGVVCVSGMHTTTAVIVNELEERLIFDLEKWATYFAIIDFSNAYHGVISKSVKFYYNPVTAKFEPIGFDGHISTNYINDFLLLDFLDPNNKNCLAIC